MKISKGEQSDEAKSSDPYNFSSLENKKEIDFKKIPYSELMKLLDKRNIEQQIPTFTEDEARAYYGEKCCDLLTKIFEFCREGNYTIYQHATNPESADNTIQKGFIVSQNSIDSIPVKVLQNKPVDIEEDEDGVKTFIYNGEQCEIRLSGIRDELSDTQHFFANSYCHLDYGNITNPSVNRNRQGYGATLLFIVSNEVAGSREHKQYGIREPHYDNLNDKEVGESFFERHVIPKQFCIGYLDVKNKRFVANPSFRFNYEVNDELTLAYESATQRDLSIQLMNSIAE